MKLICKECKKEFNHQDKNAKVCDDCFKKIEEQRVKKLPKKVKIEFWKYFMMNITTKFQSRSSQKKRRKLERIGNKK